MIHTKIKQKLMPSTKKRICGYFSEFMQLETKKWLQGSDLSGTSELIEQALMLLMRLTPDQYKALEKIAFKNGRTIYGEAGEIFKKAIEARIKELEDQ